MIPRNTNWHAEFVHNLELKSRAHAVARRSEYRRQRSWSRYLRKRLATLLAAGAITVGGSLDWNASVRAELPTGADVVAGAAIINSAGPVMDVNATSSRTIINWNQFSIGSGNTANFNLPDSSSAILNRVTTPDMPSVINGALNSNGHVMLVNPSGIMVGASGMVNTNAFTASTFDIANDKFMAGGALTFSGDSAASLENNGTINTEAGGAHLIANDISNNGSITSSGGNITLSGGGEVTLNNGVTYVQPTLQTLSSGISPTAGLIQNTGTIRATGAATSGGEVYLVNPNGKILHDGTIAAHCDPKALTAGSSIGPSVSPATSAVGSQGGHVQLEADEITLSDTSSIDVSGTDGGGTVLVGGDWQGSGNMTQATSVTMDAGATIDASATESGDGGKIVLWSDVANAESITQAFGTLVARGGELFGSGGQIETSGATIETDGVSVDAGAANGDGGLWLIDPYNYLIDAVAASNIVSALNTGTSVTVTTTGDNASYGSSGTNTDRGDIVVNSDIVTGAMSGDATLTLQAHRHINVDANIDATQNGNTAKLNVTLLADSDHSGDGINIVNGDFIKTNGGNLAFGDGSTATIGGSSVQVGGDVYISGTAAQLLETGGGTITVNGETILANTNGVTFDSGDGAIVFGGVLNSGNQYTGVTSTQTWVGAVTHAKSGTGDQLGDTYLATITSRLENAIAGIAVDYAPSWLGGRRVTGIGTDSLWRWVTGPEGLQDSGDGLIFATGSHGATPVDGAFTNWNSGEPNNSGGNETVVQFVGAAGNWNDLPHNSSTLTQYVRETNLAPTAVTINAGSGSVTFNGGIGGSKTLASLDVTASQGIVINGGQVNTTGTQTFRSPVLLGDHTHFSTIQSDIVFDSTVDSNSTSTPWNLTTTITPGNVYHWVDWTNWDEATKTATGTIVVGTDVITVTYHNPQGIFEAQTSGGTNFWTGYSGAAFSGKSPYVSTSVANGPSTSDIIKLQYAGSQTLTFSESVENLAFSIVSMNGNGYGFDQDFTIVSNSGVNGAGAGYYGSGTMTKTIVGDTFQLNDAGVNGASVGGNSEPHGTIRFGNAFSTLSWNSLSNEVWNAFTVGVSGTSNTAGAVRFNGQVGDNAALGAVTMNGAVQTTADIAGASSFNVSGLANIGGSITTSGNQSFSSAITLGDDVVLETTSNGAISTVSTIDGAHDLTIKTSGTGDVTLAKSVGGTSALTDLTIQTDELNASDIALAAGADLSVNNQGASSIDGVISGSNVTVSKAADGSLTLSGTNTYSGGTTVSAGTLAIGADANLGTAPGSATAGHLTLDGGTLLVTGNMTLNSNRGIELGDDDGAINVSAGATMQFSGIVAGNGDFEKAGTGKLSVSGTNTYTGATRVSGGILDSNNLSALGDQSSLTLDNTAGVSLNMLSDLTIGSLSGGGTTGGTVSLGSSKLTTGLDDKSTNFAGVISGTGNVTKAGVGDFTLNANNTYTGSTTINAGQIIIENDAPTFATSSIDGPGSLTIRSASDSFSSALNTSVVTLGANADLESLTIGKSTNTADITIGSAVTVGGPINIYGGDIGINAGITSTGSNRVTLHTTGNVTDGASGSIVADSLLLTGTGNVNLDSVSNNVATLAADIGSINYVDSNALTIGTVGSTNGITATGTVAAATRTGDLTVDQSIATTDTSSSAVVLNAGASSVAGTASGGNVLLSGSPTITVGIGGRSTLYTGSVAGSTGLTDLVGSGSRHFRYNSDESATNFSLALGSGVYGVYRERPTISGAVGNQTVTYGTAHTLTPTITGTVNGDTTAQVFGAAPTIAVGGSTSTSGNYTVGDHGLTIAAGAEQLGYAVNTFTGGTLTVNAKSITTSIAINGKVYDGTNAATITAGANGTILGDAVTVNGSAAFDNANAGTGKSVTVTGINLSGADASNYVLSSTSDTGTADITKKQVTVSGLGVANGIYDGSVVATVDHSGVVFSGKVSGDHLTADSTSGMFDSKNIGTGKMVTLNGTVYGGSDVDNYAFVDQETTTANITAREVTVTGITVADKVYDGNAMATVDLSGVAFDGIVSGDELTVSGTTATFDNKNVGTDKTVALAGTTYGGTDSGNYSFTNQATAVANISRLGSVMWIGGATGDWSDPANWAGGAIPDLANVANVIIPNGVTPTFNSSVVGPVDIESLTGGNFQIDSGTLNVAQDATLDEYTQNGGAFNVGGNMSVNHFAQNGGSLGITGRLDVTNSFSQSPTGTIDVTGDVNINQSIGDLQIENLSGHNVNLNSPNGGVRLGDIDAAGTLAVTAGNGNVDQLPGKRINVAGASTFDATGDITLTNPNNDFVGPVNANGNNVSITDGHGGLILNDVTTVGTFDATSTDGPILQDASGTMTINGAATFNATDGGAPADILLGGMLNDFRDVVNASGRDIGIVDADGGVLLGTIDASGQLGVLSNGGPITQTPGGSVRVEGESSFTAQANGQPKKVILNNKSNHFGGKVNIDADTFELDDEDGKVALGRVRSSSMDNALNQATSSLARDTNTRYTAETNSGTGILNVVQRYGQRWMSQLAERLFGDRNNSGPTLTKESVQKVDNDVFLNVANNSEGGSRTRN